MRRAWLAVAWMASFRCGGSSLAPGAVPTTDAVTGCEVGAPLTGAAYDLTKSRFAFGSPPVRDDANGSMRRVGDHGVVAIEVSGGEIGSLNGGTPEASLPGWSSDLAALEAHVSAYFASFGITSCQTANAQEFDGTGGRTISLPRSPLCQVS